MSKQAPSLKAYRAAIRAKWLPLVGRSRFTSYEYELTRAWYDQATPLSVILKAIDAVSGRDAVVYSLGVLEADIEALLRKQGKLQAGAKTASEPGDWRDLWEEDLLGMADENPDKKDDYLKFIAELPNMSRDQAIEKWKTISRNLM